MPTMDLANMRNEDEDVNPRDLPTGPGGSVKEPYREHRGAGEEQEQVEGSRRES